MKNIDKPVANFFIPGILIQIITFPGVIVHELAHQLFCRWTRVAVFKVVYFQLENPAGYVLHEIPPKKIQSLLISIGPFFINTILGFLIGLPVALQFEFNEPNLFSYILGYFAVSIAMHSFPSTGDAETMWKSIMNQDDTSIWMKIITAPIVLIIYLGAIGSVFWLDVLYGLAIAIWSPYLILKLFI